MSVSSEHIGVDRSHDERERILHGVTLDEGWEYRRVLEEEPPSESIETGMSHVLFCAPFG